MYKHKNLGTKSQELSNLKFWGRVFVSESMSHEISSLYMLTTQECQKDTFYLVFQQCCTC